MYYFTYVLRSQKDDYLYTGWTDDIRKRLSMHNSGKVEATRHRTPLILIYCEMCLNREKAILREKALKTGFGRRYLKNRI